MSSSTVSLFAGYDGHFIATSQECQWSIFVLSFVALVSAYHVFTGPSGFATVKQVAWIITTMSSFVMTVASLPFVWDYVRGGGDVKGIRAFPELAVSISRFFQAYLLADLSIGSVYYRSQINILTGWFHHILYLGIVEYAIRQQWAHVFVMAAVMELPTCILGLATLFPRLRSNILFAVCFFFTRILFHIIICIAYYLPKNRPLAPSAVRLSSSTTVAPTGSTVPAIIMACVFPLHASWFFGCLKGFQKRAKLRREAEVKTRESFAPVLSLGVHSAFSKKAESKTTSAKSSADVPQINLRRRQYARYIYDHYSHYYSMRYAHYSSRYAHYHARFRGLGLRSPKSVKESLQRRLPLLRPTFQRLPSLETLSSLPALSSLPSPIFELSPFGFDVKPIDKVIAALPTREKLYETLGLGKPAAYHSIQAH